MSGSVRVGIVSDTHGTVPPSLVRALAGVSRILHAGDVGTPRVLDDLARIAPVAAVRGNTDSGVDPELSRLPAFAVVDVAGVRFAVTHIRGRALGLDQARLRGCDVYVFGHTHVPVIEKEDGMLVINPGSASRPRGGHAASVAVVSIESGVVTGAEIVGLG